MEKNFYKWSNMDLSLEAIAIELPGDNNLRKIFFTLRANKR